MKVLVNSRGGLNLGKTSMPIFKAEVGILAIVLNAISVGNKTVKLGAWHTILFLM